MPPSTTSLREPLRDTHGVVVFQDQVLDVAMALAGFTIGEAEGLRRAMSRKRSEEVIEVFRSVHRGCRAERVDGETADRVYDKLAAFPASASSRMQPRSGCSPTSRPGCATTTRPSSSARS
jgi:error-prone DNA polymerase